MNRWRGRWIEMAVQFVNIAGVVIAVGWFLPLLLAHMKMITQPGPQEYNEPAIWHTTWLLDHGRNPYTAAELPGAGELAGARGLLGAREAAGVGGLAGAGGPAWGAGVAGAGVLARVPRFGPKVATSDSFPDLWLVMHTPCGLVVTGREKSQRTRRPAGERQGVGGLRNGASHGR